MTLIVEDGTVVAGAESYISVSDANTYHTAYGNDAWSLLDTSVKEACLRRATAYMMQVYRSRWKGTRLGLVQSLDWPRFGVQIEDVAFARFPYYVPTTVVPNEVKQACAELALKASTADLAPDIEREVLDETIGPIHTQYRAGVPQYTRYRAIDLMLKMYLEPAASAQLVRS